MRATAQRVTVYDDERIAVLIACKSSHCMTSKFVESRFASKHEQAIAPCGGQDGETRHRRPPRASISRSDSRLTKIVPATSLPQLSNSGVHRPCAAWTCALPTRDDTRGDLAPSALSYHPHAPGPSRPIHEREQQAEQHLEDRSDHRKSCYGKPRNSMWGLDAGRRFTEGISIGA